jgi:hypothetical protein
MSLESVKAFFADKAPEIEVIELPTSTATVALAAEAHGVEPGQIAKTLSFAAKDQTILIVTRGDARIDNRKFKDQFGTKPRMLDAESVLNETSHRSVVFVRLDCPAPCPFIAICRSRLSTKLFRLPGLQTVQCGSHRRKWPSLFRLNGLMFASKASVARII